jgi:hypothetical protein
MSWTTNVGQKEHSCDGSDFQVVDGKHNGLMVKNGMLLTKGECPHSTSPAKKSSKPHFTQLLSCEATATGCHMWCAPVWQSHYDTTDWSAFDSRCKGWNGELKKDTACAQAGRLFTWARTEVPVSKNMLELSFAISEGCSHWCAPLWVTVYDTKNWAKSFRWCINRKDDWGVCDSQEDVSINVWHDRTFKFSQFMQKHGYDADHYALEFAVYSEFEKAEVLINNIALSKAKDITTTLSPEEEKAKNPPSINKCGSTKCGSEEQCCRGKNPQFDAKCCPKEWSCCEDSCCPSYYKCTVTEFGHTCKPPHEAPKPLGLCQLK